MRPFVAFTLTISVAALVEGCGSSAPPPKSSSVAVAPPAPAPEPGPTESVSRAAVDAAIKAGLGRFLANLEVEPSLDAKNKFVGWKIVKLEGEMWTGVDLHPGDVVTRVNGLEIQRESEADRAFKSLAIASEIRVSLIRDGKPAELRFAIVEEGEAPAK